MQIGFIFFNVFFDYQFVKEELEIKIYLMYLDYLFGDGCNNW